MLSSAGTENPDNVETVPMCLEEHSLSTGDCFAMCDTLVVESPQAQQSLTMPEAAVPTTPTRRIHAEMAARSPVTPTRDCSLPTRHFTPTPEGPVPEQSPGGIPPGQPEPLTPPATVSPMEACESGKMCL